MNYPEQGEPQCTMEVKPYNLPELGHEGHPTYYKGYKLPPKAFTSAGRVDDDHDSPSYNEAGYDT